VLDKYPTLGADQAAMVRVITQDGDGISLVVGRAGAGKTFGMNTARHAWATAGIPVVGAAPTGAAVVRCGMAPTSTACLRSTPC
jgi:AAA domain